MIQIHLRWMLMQLKTIQSWRKSVDFYIVVDTETGNTLAISKTQFEDPKFNLIIKNDLGKEVGPKYELEFINNRKIISENLLINFSNQ